MIVQSCSAVRIFLAFILLSLLSACGGGSGGSKSISLDKSSAAVFASSVRSSVSSVSVAAASEPNPLSSLAAATSSQVIIASSVTASSVPRSSVAVSSARGPLLASSAAFVQSSPAAGAASSSLARSSSQASLAASSAVLSSSSLRSSSPASSSLSSVAIKALSISVAKTELIVGEEIAIAVMGVYPDGHMEPQADAFWVTSVSGIVSLQGRTLAALHAGTTIVSADIQAAGGSLSSNALSITVRDAPSALLNIELSAADSGALMLGNSRLLKVTGDYTNAEGVAIANGDVKFVSGNTQVAEISVGGSISARALGKTTITASYQGKSASYDIEVVAEAISFHILKPAAWKNTLNAHWFANKVLGTTSARLSTFPGTAMQDLDGDGWYDITLNGLSEINIMFNDGGSVSDGFHQTADQYARKGGWLVLDEFANPAGKYYGTWYDSKPTLSEQPVCDVKTFGAKGDGSSKDTVAIQKAIDACAGKNGIVRLSSGKFVAGTIVLKSDMTLRIEPTATLLGTRDAADYPDQPKLSGNSQYLNCRKALIYAEKAKNIRIDGGGTIDGNGGSGSPWMSGLEATRPMAIFLVQTDGITLQNITVRNSAMWTVVPFESSNIIIRGVTVNSQTGHNLDGIDIVDGHHVLIESVDITSQDDAICLKSGSTDLGVVDVMVRYSKVNKSTVANGLKFGTATKGPFRDITFDNISLNNVTRGGIAVESVDGSAVSNIVYRNITMDKVGTPFYIVLGYRSKDANAVQRVGSIDNITFENIVATNTTKTWGSYMSGVVINGQTYRVTDLLFKNIDVSFLGGSNNLGTPWEYNATYSGEYPDPGPSTNTATKKDMPGYLYFRHADNVNLINTKVSASPVDTRPAIVTDDVTGYTNTP